MFAMACIDKQNELEAEQQRKAEEKKRKKIKKEEKLLEKQRKAEAKAQMKREREEEKLNRDLIEELGEECPDREDTVTATEENIIGRNWIRQVTCTIL